MSQWLLAIEDSRELVPIGDISDNAIPLPALYGALIPALCFGRIRHGMRLDYVGSDGEENHTPWIVGGYGVFQDQALLVSQGPQISTDDLCTHVFNLSNQEIRIRKGQVVSYLVQVSGHQFKLGGA